MKRQSKDELFGYASSPRLELIGMSECVVEGLKSICEYNHDRIRISLGKYCVTFYGDCLRIDSFSPKGAVIEGTIISMEFDTNA